MLLKFITAYIRDFNTQKAHASSDGNDVGWAMWVSNPCALKVTMQRQNEKFFENGNVASFIKAHFIRSCFKYLKHKYIEVSDYNRHKAQRTIVKPQICANSIF